MEISQPRQARINFGIAHAAAATGKACGVQVLQEKKDSIGTMLDGQAVGHPTDIEALPCIAFIPRRLNLIRLELSLMRTIGRPASRMGLLVRPTHVLQNNAGGRTTGEMTSHNLPIAAPQTLNDLGTRYRRCARRAKHDCSKSSVELIRLGHVVSSPDEMGTWLSGLRGILSAEPARILAGGVS